MGPSFVGLMFNMLCRHHHGLLGLWKWRGKQIRLDRSHPPQLAHPFWILNDHLRHSCDGFRLLHRQVIFSLLVRDSHCRHIHMAKYADGLELVKTDSKH